MSVLRNIYKVLVLIVLSLGINFTCISAPVVLKPGIWKAELFNKDGITIPFTFEVKNKNGKQIIEIINADDRLQVDEFSSVGDSLKINMPFFDSEFMLSVKGDSLVGRWTRIYPNKTVSMPVKATYNNPQRFNVKTEINKNIEGTWNTIFSSENGTDSSFAIGEFKIVNNKVYGTFLSSTGDYRFLEGVTSKNNLYLSTFDGSHAYLFTASISDDGKNIFNGKLFSGWASKEIWSAKKDPNAKLPNADSLTFLKEGFDEINFSFKNLNGELISLNDNKYKNKVVAIQIMGTWCPNCMDETNYLVPFYNSMNKDNFEIIGLCYERSEDFKVAVNNVKKMKDRMGIPYELLIPGSNKKGFVNESLPMLKNFVAFPTMIIIDKKGKVRKIHTGYSGPATGNHYIEFKKDFESFILKLQSEK